MKLEVRNLSNREVYDDRYIFYHNELFHDQLRIVRELVFSKVDVKMFFQVDNFFANSMWYSLNRDVEWMVKFHAPEQPKIMMKKNIKRIDISFEVGRRKTQEVGFKVLNTEIISNELYLTVRDGLEFGTFNVLGSFLAEKLRE